MELDNPVEILLVKDTRAMAEEQQTDRSITLDTTEDLNDPGTGLGGGRLRQPQPRVSFTPHTPALVSSEESFDD